MQPGPPGHRRVFRLGQMIAGDAFSNERLSEMKRKGKYLRRGVLATACLTFGMIASHATAQNARNCGPREMVVDRLAEGYGETRKSMGLGSNNSIVEVFASSETGTWTITVTTPNGVTCLVASGQAFEELAEALPAMGNDA